MFVVAFLHYVNYMFWVENKETNHITCSSEKKLDLFLSVLTFNQMCKLLFYKKTNENEKYIHVIPSIHVCVLSQKAVFDSMS